MNADIIKLLTVISTVIVAVGNGLLTFFRWSERWRDASLTYQTLKSAQMRYRFEAVGAQHDSEAQRKSLESFMKAVESAKTREWTSFFEAVTKGMVNNVAGEPPKNSSAPSNPSS